MNSSLVGVELEKDIDSEIISTSSQNNIPSTMTSSLAERCDYIDVSSIIEESWQIDDIPNANDVSSVEPLPAPVESPASQTVDNRIILRTLNSLYQFVQHAVQSGAIGPPKQSSVQKFVFHPLDNESDLELFDALLGVDEQFRENVKNVYFTKSSRQ